MYYSLIIYTEFPILLQHVIRTIVFCNLSLNRQPLKPNLAGNLPKNPILFLLVFRLATIRSA